MSIISVASGQSVYRGYEYAQEKKVLQMEQSAEGVIKATVAGSNSSNYEVIADIAHPRRSQCTCPYAAGKRIVCKHIVAVYFTAFPQEARKYIEELESCWEEEQRQEEMEDTVIRYVYSLKKSDLQQKLLQVLFEGPDCQFDRFIRENIGY